MAIDFESALTSAAADVRRRFGAFVEMDELLSEGWVWRLSHDGTFDGYERDEQPKRAQYRLRRDLMRAMERYARQVKADASGYSIADEAFYGEAMVGTILPAILHKDFHAPQAPLGPRGNTDPAEGGTWMAQRADVAQAWRDAPLSPQERDAMILYHGFGKSQVEIGELTDSLQQTVSNRLSSGMRKLIAAIGGDKPKGCPYDCVCHEARLRVRPGVHSEISGRNQDLR